MGGRNLGDVVEMIVMQGGTYEGAFSVVDELGEPLDSTWRGRIQIRDVVGGTLLATFAFSDEEGSLVITDYGQALVSLPSSSTSALSSTADSLGLNTRHYVGDLEVWRAQTPAVRYKPETPFRVFVRPEVTT